MCVFAFFFFFFFAVAVSGYWILKLSGTGLVYDPSKKGNRTETGPDLKALFTVDNNPFVNFKFTCQINVDSCTHDFTSAATTAENLSTHVSRNSSQLQQEMRVLTQKTLSHAQKATGSLQQASTHAKDEELISHRSRHYHYLS